MWVMNTNEQARELEVEPFHSESESESSSEASSRGTRPLSFVFAICLPDCDGGCILGSPVFGLRTILGTGLGSRARISRG